MGICMHYILPNARRQCINTQSKTFTVPASFLLSEGERSKIRPKRRLEKRDPVVIQECIIDLTIAYARFLFCFVFLLLFVFASLGMDLRASCTLDKYVLSYIHSLLFKATNFF